MLFKSSKKISMVFLILVCTMQASLAYSVTDERTTLQTKKPHDVLEQVTSELLETIDVHRETFSNDPEAFFDELDRLLVNVIDFDWIAYRVMGKYAKKSSVEQKKRFAYTFKRELIETYGRGLLSYGEQSIVTIPPKKDIGDLKSTRVVQEIRGSDGVFPLVYSMSLTRTGSWKVTNLVINGINLGKIFRNQFTQRARKLEGNVDKVIDTWSSSSK
ncbi:MAG: toluene tolerance protein [Porticoccus sp.]|jgi:phospholipid transport system substrate-binding protein|nr:toluene tolerance protein [Porticoccus sp.]